MNMVKVVNIIFAYLHVSVHGSMCMCACVHVCMHACMHAGVTHCIEVHSNDLPHSAPLQPHTVHVVVGDLDDLLEAEHAGMGRAGQFLVRHGTQGLNKVN